MKVRGLDQVLYQLIMPVIVRAEYVRSVVGGYGCAWSPVVAGVN